MSKVIYYHFSDLHFKSRDDFDRKRVLTALWKDIKSQMTDGLVPDFIIVTGDLAFSGKPGEYARADSEFLIPLSEMTGTAKNRFYFVPGNHDFDRALLAHLKSETIMALDSRDRVNSFLGDGLNLEMYLKPFDNFASFVRKFTGADYFQVSPAYAYVDSIRVSGAGVSIVGLNSSWASNYRSEGAHPSDDKSHLIIGERQFLGAIESIQPSSSVVLALAHHPFSWLAEFDDSVVRHEIMEKCLLFHHGHIHKAHDISYSRMVAGECFVFGVAACYDRRIGTDHYANGYAIVVLDLAARRVEARVRRYVDAPTPHWTSNEDLLGEGTRGRIQFSLPSNSIGKAYVASDKSRPASLFEIYRSCALLAGQVPVFTQAMHKLSAARAQHAAPSVLQYEELACSCFLELQRESHDSHWATAVGHLFSEAMIRRLLGGSPAERKDLRGILGEVVDSLCRVSNDAKPAIKSVAKCWQLIFCNWGAAPYALLHEVEPDVATAVAPAALLAVTLMCFSDDKVAALIAGMPELGPENGPLPMPSRSRILSGSVIEVTTTCPNEETFIYLSRLRFRLEQRMEQITEVFASSNLGFPLHALRIMLVGDSPAWREKRFTVDTVRIMKLLMGKELYGDESQDIWFREILQNALDACKARERLTGNAREHRISVENRPEEGSFIIRDNGIGMSPWHIDHFLCKVGRSIWRSEELAKFSEGRVLTHFSIGRFGIGFLSVFEVARQVNVETRFFQEEAGHALTISSIQEPFFIREQAGLEPGTQVTMIFRGDYKPDLKSIARRYLAYSPTGVRFQGLPDVPESPEKALESAVRDVELSRELTWFHHLTQLSNLKARLYVAVPMSSRNFQKSKAEFPDECGITISNGGIVVYRSNDDWVGSRTEHSYRRPSSYVNGVRAILDFEAGEAPVTISRKEVRISDEEAEGVLAAITAATRKAWKSLANQLFGRSGSSASATRKFIRALNNSASSTRRYSWRSPDDWCENEDLVKAAVDLLRSFGSLETLRGKDMSKHTCSSIADLEGESARVILVTQDRAKSPLFRLYVSQVADGAVVVVPDDRAVDLLSACSTAWVAIRTDEDLWSVMDIREIRGWALRSLIPADAAIVDKTYFVEPEQIAIVLPRRRTPANVIGGRSREELDSIDPRVLLNGTHPLWEQLESLTKTGKLDETVLNDQIKLLFSLVINEKAKTRRHHEQPVVIGKLLALAQLPRNTRVQISM